MTRNPLTCTGDPIQTIPFPFKVVSINYQTLKRDVEKEEKTETGKSKL